MQFYSQRLMKLDVLFLIVLLCFGTSQLWAQTDEPTAEPTVEVTLMPTAEPTDLTAEPTLEPTSDTTAEPTDEPTVETTPEATVEATQETTSEATSDVTDEPTAEATEAPTTEPTAVATTAPVEVEAEADDGLMLQGSYYAVAAASDADAPAVLLLHMNQSTRVAWDPIIQPLVDAGYNVLAVDLRGFGETGGDVDFDLALTDAQTWFDWLRTQPEVDPALVSVMGASIGSNLALVGCGNDEECVTAIALSPGTDYFGIKPGDFLNDTLIDRPILLIVSQLDTQSISGVESFFTTARGEVGARIFTGNSHGTNLFLSKGDALIPFIIGWLDEHVEAKREDIAGN